MVDVVLALLIGSVAAIGALVTVFLRRPRLAIAQAPPEAVLRDIAFRLRASGMAVEESGRFLRVPIGSLSALKVHTRARPTGTEVSYEVDMTPLAWTLVLSSALLATVVPAHPITLFLAGIPALVIAAIVAATGRSFARNRLRPLLDARVLGQAPPPGPQSLLIEGLSEARRLVSDTLMYERAAGQDAIALILLGSLALWAFLFFAAPSYLPPPFQGNLLANLALATGSATIPAVLGSLLVHRSRARLVSELERERDRFGTAMAWETLGSLPPEGQRGGLELLLHAAARTPVWREIRRRRRIWHDVGTGFTIFLLGEGSVFSLALAALDFLSLAWRAGLGGLGVLFAAGLAWTVRSWRREMAAQDARDQENWDRRRARVESELWKLLAG